MAPSENADGGKSQAQVLLVRPGVFARPVAQEAVARDWETRGYDCRLFVDGPGQAWNGFVHASNELVTVVAGALECEVNVNGRAETLRLEAGDELFIPRQAVHSVRNVSPGTTRWLFGYDEPA